MIRAIVCAVTLVGGLTSGVAAHAEPVHIRHSGLSLVGEMTRAPGTTLREGLVLLLHGTLAHHRMELIASLQALLLERGHSSLAVSLSLGISDRSGMYACDREHRHRHTDAVQELAAWVAWLKRQGAGPITVLGHSRGGNQAALYAIRHPDDVSAVVLLAPATHEPARDAAAYRSRNGKALEPILQMARSSPPATMLEAVPFLYCGPSRVQADSFLSYHAPDPERHTPSLLPRVTQPALIIAGSADTTVPDVARQVALFDDANSTLVVIDGADHFFRDLYADDVADAIDAFLQRQPP